jgi:hypothetical protein
MWCIPPARDCQFVAAMEDVPEVYHRPHGPERPRVCTDEKPVRLTGGVRPPPAPAPRRAERYDCEYVRDGVANLFIAFEPVSCRRHVGVTDARERGDFARFVRGSVDGRYKGAEKVVLVMDQPDAHGTAGLYAAFPPEEARRIAREPGIHFPPEHGSWPDMAEIEFSALERQCPDERMDDAPTSRREVAAWELRRNDSKATVGWRFTAADARVKLKRLYPIQV